MYHNPISDAWVDGSLTTAQLHDEMTDSEYLRWLRDDYALELIYRYEPEDKADIYYYGCYPAEAVASYDKPKNVPYTLATREGCIIEWSHGGFTS